MPPKPWETQKSTSNFPNFPLKTPQQGETVTSNEIKTNSLEPTAMPLPPGVQSPESIVLNQTSSITPGLTGTSMSNPLMRSSSMPGAYSSPYSSYGGGYGSSSMYGGASSSYGSRYGSSYGGYGGSSYGGFGGGYGGMNRYGMNSDPNNQGYLENGMRFLDSFNYVVNSLCDVARNLESNADGLGRFWVSIFNLVFRMKNWSVSLTQWVINLFKKIFCWVRDFIKRKFGEWFLLNGEQKEEMHLKILKLTLRIALILFILSFVPLLFKQRARGGGLNGIFEQSATV